MEFDIGTCNAVKWLRVKVTKLSSLAHCNNNQPNIFPIQASAKSLGATLWQPELDCELKSFIFANKGRSETCEILNEQVGTISGSVGVIILRQTDLNVKSPSGFKTTNKT